MQKKWFRQVMVTSCIAGLLFPIILHAAPYELTDLGTLGGNDNFSFSINNLNEVTGNADGPIIADDQIDENNPAVVCQSADGTSTNRQFCFHAYLYSQELLTDLGDLGDSISVGLSINDHSTIVGYARELVGDEGQRHEKAFISFAGGAVQALPYPVQVNPLPEGILEQQRALDISNDRKIVGYTLRQHVNDAEETSTQNRPFLYDYDLDSYSILPLFSDDIHRAGVARSINSSGLIVGWAISEDDQNPAHALLWDPASPELSTDLGTLGGYTSGAYAINDNGIIVGRSETSKEFADNQNLAFIYDPAAETPMMAIPEFSDHENLKISQAYGINNNNQVVGSAQIGTGFSAVKTGFLYEYDTDTLINLNDMVDCSLGWEIIIARDINDNGYITGTGTVDGEVHSFLLTPTADTESTNCTALRIEEEKQQRLALISGSGSFNPLLLLFSALMLYWRRR